MKKIQCEVCGSTEIKKVGDDLFECQSCGVQYSKNDVSKLLVEITGEVKIDHTEDIENLTIRAERFYEDGDTDKALEYYERVLDADPDNENALSKIEVLKKQQSLDLSLSDTFLFEAKETKEQCVDRFFRSLQSQKNIVHDIYKEIVVDNVSAEYFPFCFLKANGTLDWSATRCDVYYEQQTVYKKEYNSNTKRYETVPKTEKERKVNKTPVSGTEKWSCSRLVLANRSLIDRIKSPNVANRIAEGLEKHLDILYNSDELSNVHSKKVEEKSNAKYYKNILFDDNIDYSIVDAKRDKMYNDENHYVAQKAVNRVGGDYYENMHTSFSVNRSTSVTILVPLCIVNYTYKNEKYTAVIDMFPNHSYIELVFPIEKVLDETDKKVQALETKISKHGHATGILVGALIIGFIAMGIAAMFNAGVFGVIAMVLWLGGLIYFCVDMAQGKKLHKKKNIIEEDANKNLIGPRIDYLEKTAARFINGFSNYDNLTSIQSLLPASDIEIAEFLCSETTSFADSDNKQFINEKDEKNMNEIKTLAQTNKLDAIKKYVELYGVGLAEAKTAVEKIILDNTSTASVVANQNETVAAASVEEEILNEIKQLAKTNKIEAISRYRKEFNVGLQKAKEAIDQMTV